MVPEISAGASDLVSYAQQVLPGVTANNSKYYQSEPQMVRERLRDRRWRWLCGCGSALHCFLARCNFGSGHKSVRVSPTSL